MKAFVHHVEPHRVLLQAVRSSSIEPANAGCRSASMAAPSIRSRLRRAAVISRRSRINEPPNEVSRAELAYLLAMNGERSDQLGGWRGQLLWHASEKSLKGARTRRFRCRGRTANGSGCRQASVGTPAAKRVEVRAVPSKLGGRHRVRWSSSRQLTSSSPIQRGL